MIAIDIEHFRLYNKIHGREEGDALLRMIADILREFEEEHAGVVGYLGGDNFGIFAVCELMELRKLRLRIEDAVREKSDTIGYMPAFGVYAVTDKTLPAATMYDHATVALTHVLGDFTNRLCYYDPDMDDKVEEELRILSDVQVGIDNDEFTFYIQPQCDITKGKIVGGESLVRWIHREKGLVPPGVLFRFLRRTDSWQTLTVLCGRKSAHGSVSAWIRDMTRFHCLLMYPALTFLRWMCRNIFLTCWISIIFRRSCLR